MMYIILSGLILCFVAIQPGLLDVATNDVPLETDDDRLNQALLLVEILKSEYLKLLRERSGGAATDTVTVEQSTCATTAESFFSTDKQKTEMLISSPNTVAGIPRRHPKYPALVYTAAPPDPWGWPVPGTPVPSRRFYNIMPEPVPPIYPNMLPYPRRFFRRNFPEYSYYYGPYRRSDNYDENREVTAKAKEIKTSTTTKKIASSTWKATRNTSQLFAGSRRRFNTHLQRSNYQNPRRSQVSEQVQKSGLKEIADNENNKTANTSSPIASSAIITTKITDRSNTTTSNKWKLHHTIKPKVPSTPATIDKWPAFLFKSTLRVFLENSTPLPIPLPENNAFCFTNPRNALCRSP
ncbi:uncharacterized protein LOC133516022 [Cydia pomonella]|uniref:uncharacterized protein LOC133516022 n=1 Tax=Cydia pomonella TaxID=82600 RepID=UPI002ADDC35F|nr:uncharacterized protein LOC133516022 [Cydia pomonella]XP_061704695.1 uncharacterized protein LOC133516022 [Cydia pomonella]XP_061704703.1 uncharacterized protein LOC133516022 [Cydia pomonella]XP_061704712.1 uncharacterized protein LOC133516022 [Cydia pomonella]